MVRQSTWFSKAFACWDMLRLLLTNRRQDIFKSTHITDITELGKHTDSMQKVLFGECKAKELNFVGELAEKVSKAIQPQRKKNQFKEKSSRGNSSSNTHGQNDHSSHQPHSPSRNQSSQSFNRKRPYNNNRTFRRAPSQGKPYSQAPNRNYMQGKQR